MSHSQYSNYEDEGSPRRVSHLRLIISLILLAILTFIGMLYVSGALKVFYVESGSMEPTLQIGDRILMNGTGAYDRFDVIAFTLATSDEPYIKRIVGLGGDKIEIRSGILYINGEEQYSRFIRGNTINWHDVAVEVPYDELFVLGDNRNESEDSLNFGPIKQAQVIGVLQYIYWPTSRWGKVNRIDELEAMAEEEATEE